MPSLLQDEVPYKIFSRQRVFLRIHIFRDVTLCRLMSDSRRFEESGHVNMKVPLQPTNTATHFTLFFTRSHVVTCRYY